MRWLHSISTSRTARWMAACLLMLPALAGCGSDPVSKAAGKGASRGVNKLINLGKKKIRQSVRELGKNPDTALVNLQLLHRYQVFGYEPSWNAYKGGWERHYYNLLSHLVIGEYDINPETGDARVDTASRVPLNTTLLDSARLANPGIRVLLLASYTGDYGAPAERESNYDYLLTDAQVQRRLSDSLGALLAHPLFQGDGIVLELGRLPAGSGPKVVKFIDGLRRWKLKDYDIYLKLPPQGREVYDAQTVKALSDGPHVAGFILQGYGFAQTDSLLPMAPVQGRTGQDIASALAYYEGAGLDLSRAVVETPWFADVRQQQGSAYIPHPVRPQIPLDEVKARKPSYFPGEEGVSYVTRDGYAYVYDDGATLRRKYAWLRQAGAGGASIYGLGYNTIDEGPWRAVSGAFASAPPRLIYPSLGFLLLFIAGGIIGSVIRFWQVRNVIAKRRAHQWYYGLALMAVVIVFAICITPPAPPQAAGGASFILVLFPFLRRFTGMIKRWTG
ncbi:MAG: glycoside hydrolase family 18 protein [Bacteroidia bacterium]|nr:glycoside hydrolase family 18 protein [Bacteroidia bacterium]